MRGVSVEECQRACTDLGDCLAFGWSSKKNKCLLSPVTATDGSAPWLSGKATWVFNQRDCA